MRLCGIYYNTNLKNLLKWIHFTLYKVKAPSKIGNEIKYKMVVTNLILYDNCPLKSIIIDLFHIIIILRMDSNNILNLNDILNWI